MITVKDAVEIGTKLIQEINNLKSAQHESKYAGYVSEGVNLAMIHIWYNNFPDKVKQAYDNKFDNWYSACEKAI